MFYPLNYEGKIISLQKYIIRKEKSFCKNYSLGLQPPRLGKMDISDYFVIIHKMLLPFSFQNVSFPSFKSDIIRYGKTYSNVSVFCLTFIDHKVYDKINAKSINIYI